MKILLIEPAKAPVTLGGEDFFVYEPLALECVAAGVARAHDVKILDLRLEGDLEEVLHDFCPDVVGITAYTVHVNTVRALFAKIKAWNPEVLTVVGGHHATVVPGDFSSPAIDLIVVGEGVHAFQEIVARAEKGRGPDPGAGFEGIPGVAFRRNGGLVQTPPRPITGLDGFPFPERSLTARYRHRYFSEWMRPLASMRTSKGCPHRCSFCAQWKVAGGKYLKREPAEIVAELAGIDETFVFFADDESLVDVVRMKALAAQIRAAGLDKRYFLYGRSDTIARHPDLLEAWREVGLERVFVGLEFVRDEDLGFINKGSTTHDNEQAVKVLQALGIEIYASFIIRPEFDRADFRALGRYCRDLELSFATFAVLTPLPGTELYQQVESQLITHNYDYFDFIHTLLPTRLPLREFYREYARLFTSAFTLKSQWSLLRKFPVGEIPGTLARSLRVQGQLKGAYRDYGHSGGLAAD